MKKTRGMSFIKKVVEKRRLEVDRVYSNNKHKKSFKLEDLKSFGPKNILSFLEEYYNVENRSHWYGGGLEIEKWIRMLDKSNVKLVVLPKQEVETMLFPLIVDDEDGGRASYFIKRYRKIIKSLNGLVITHKKVAKRELEKSEAIKNELTLTNNWAWSKDKNAE